MSITKRFIKGHSHLFIFIGAFIVFLTFVVKEGLGERWRHVADEISSAQYIYGMRAQLSNIHDQLDFIVKLTQGDVDKSSPRTFKGHMKATIMLFDGKATILSLEAENADTQTLLQLLTDKDKFEERLADIRNRLSEITKDVNTVDKTVSVFRRNASTTPESVLRQLFQDVDAADNSLLEINGRCTELKWDVLRAAEKLRDENETCSYYSKWISAFLFALGWILGLLGKLYGIEVDSTSGAE